MGSPALRSLAGVYPRAMRPDTLWESFAQAVDDLGGASERPTPPQALAALGRTLDSPVLGFDPERNDDVLMFQIGPGASGVEASLERRLWLGADGDQTYTVQARWTFPAGGALAAHHVQVHGSGPGCLPERDVYGALQFIAALEDHPAWKELLLVAPSDAFCWHTP